MKIIAILSTLAIISAANNEITDISSAGATPSTDDAITSTSQMRTNPTSYAKVPARAITAFGDDEARKLKFSCPCPGWLAINPIAMAACQLHCGRRLQQEEPRDGDDKQAITVSGDALPSARKLRSATRALAGDRDLQTMVGTSGDAEARKLKFSCPCPGWLAINPIAMAACQLHCA